MALKSPRTAMIVTIVIIAVTFLVVVSAILAYWPKGISVNEDNKIQLSTYIGKPQLIPVDDISITEMPEGMLKHLIRTNGMSLGKINYGHFKNTKPGRRCSSTSPVRKAKYASLTMVSYTLSMIGDSSVCQSDRLMYPWRRKQCGG